jgi:hypothetical protein
MHCATDLLILDESMLTILWTTSQRRLSILEASNMRLQTTLVTFGSQLFVSFFYVKAALQCLVTVALQQLTT